jgi:hypothetical protein
LVTMVARKKSHTLETVDIYYERWSEFK